MPSEQREGLANAVTGDRTTDRIRLADQGVHLPPESIEVEIRLPTQSAYDAQGAPPYGNSGWLWSHFSPPPFILIEPPALHFSFSSDGVLQICGDDRRT